MCKDIGNFAEEHPERQGDVTAFNFNFKFMVMKTYRKSLYTTYRQVAEAVKIYGTSGFSQSSWLD